MVMMGIDSDGQTRLVSDVIVMMMVMWLYLVEWCVVFSIECINNSPLFQQHFSLLQMSLTNSLHHCYHQLHQWCDGNSMWLFRWAIWCGRLLMGMVMVIVYHVERCLSFAVSGID